MPADSSETLAYITAAARAIDLPIDECYLADVEADFLRALAMASFLMEFPLEQSVQAAPVFRP